MDAVRALVDARMHQVAHECHETIAARRGDLRLDHMDNGSGVPVVRIERFHRGLVDGVTALPAALASCGVLVGSARPSDSSLRPIVSTFGG